jgi:sterol desaturase/sphingolipid hydroxylase (fatty acid hydroxylase superfamily)
LSESLTDHLPLLVFLGLLAWESVQPAGVFVYGRAWGRLTHGVINLGLGLAGTLITALLFLPLWGELSHWGALAGWGVLRILPMPLAAQACAALLLLDLWTYWWHRMNHRIHLLWRFHRVHHCDPWMDVTCAQRFHPGEIIFSSLLRLPIILLTGVELWHLALYEVVMMSVVLFHHANIALPADADRLLRLVIPTPMMHKLHHSRLQAETDSNYGALFSIWDRLFGSYRVRAEGPTEAFGLTGYDDPTHQTLTGLLAIPFASVKKDGAA